MTKPEEEAITRRCSDCGRDVVGRRENYRYAECGLQTVVLKNTLVFHCECGSISARIPAMAGLHRAITLSLIYKDSLLSGEEVRFLRKMAGLTGVELAKSLGVHKGTLSNWETNKRHITKNSDGALRLICFVGLVQNLLQQKDIVPQLAEEIRRLSLVDIKNVLRKIREVLEGPKDVRIDPEQLPLYGESHQSLTPEVSTVQ